MAWDRAVPRDCGARSDDANKLLQLRADKLRDLQTSIRQLPDEKPSPAFRIERNRAVFLRGSNMPRHKEGERLQHLF